MKTLSFLLSGLVLLFFTATCNNTTAQTEKMEFTGTIQQQGITSYQYGTHSISNDDTFYAIKSEVVDLNDFLDEEVTIVAEKIRGYPLEGGPEYLMVLEVKKD